MGLHLKHTTAFENILQPFHRQGSWDSVSLSDLLRLPGHQVIELGFKSVSALSQDGFPPLFCCLWFFPLPWASCTRAPTCSWSPCTADLCSYSGDAAGPVGPRDARGRWWALREYQHSQILWFPGFCSQPLFSGRNQVPQKVCAAFPLWTQDEMVGWHHQPNGHEFEQTDLWLHREWGEYSSHGKGECSPKSGLEESWGSWPFTCPWSQKNCFQWPWQVLCKKNSGWAQVSSLPELNIAEVTSLGILNRKTTMPSVNNSSRCQHSGRWLTGCSLGTKSLQI